MKWILKLFCKHKWVTNWAMYGWKSQEDTFLPEDLLYEKVCEKCGKMNY